MPNFHSLKIERVWRELKTTEEGLTSREAERRINKYGLNKLPQAKPKRKAVIFINQFKSPLIYILLLAGLISFILRDWVDMGVIFSAVFINTIIGFFQENKANNALNKLKALIKHRAYVWRDGYEREVDSANLTEGDVIILKAGNRVPADARLFSADNLLVNEGMLTGESLPAEKNTNLQQRGAPLPDRTNMVYAGTIVVKGTGQAVVCAIGQETEIGRISQMVRETEDEKTPLQIRLLKFSNILGIVISIIAISIVIIGSVQGRKLPDMFITGVALAVSAVPEGLTVAVTVILVLGMQRILKRKALVRKLIAAETLSSVTVICSDKTGTLTEGEMRVAHIIIGDQEYQAKNIDSKEESEEAKAVILALQVGMMCNDALIENPHEELSEWKVIGAPTETALVLAAVQAGLNKQEILKAEPKVGELPFDNERKYMISLHRKSDGSFILYEKGAPEIVLEKAINFYHRGKICPITSEERKKFNNICQNLAKKGLRVIGVALRSFKPEEVGNKNKPRTQNALTVGSGMNGILREAKMPNAPSVSSWVRGKGIDWSVIDRNLTLIGFIALKDPLRPEAKEVIKVCRQAGMRPIIITGDHPLTARAIAQEVGMEAQEKNILSGGSLDKIDDKKLKKLVKRVDIYARVSPHHKLRIVQALKARGEVVAMTGDGINDSPALKAADIGISLGTGADIAKESSDLVLLDNNFQTIVAAIEQGRIIFSNIRKVITYLMADSFSQMILIIGSLILNLPLAILPVQILWINIIQDGLPAFSLAFENKEGDVMKEKPIQKDEPILNKEAKLIIFAAGLIRDILILILFICFYRLGVEIDYLRTMILAILVLASLASIFSIRNLNRPIWRFNPFTNIYLWGAVVISLILLLLAVYWQPLQKVLSTISLSVNAWLFIILVALGSTLMIEIVKAYSLWQDKKVR